MAESTMKPWEKYQTSSGAPWEKYANIQSPSQPKTDVTDALIGGAKQGFLMGYAPNIEAGLERGAEYIGSAFGRELPKEDYLQKRDRNIKEYQTLSQEHPYAYGAGQVGGGLLTLPVTGALGVASKVPGLAKLAQSSGTLANIGKATGAGAIYGLAQNPGDIEGEYSPIQPLERIEGAKEGAKFGALTSVGSLVAKGALSKISKMGPELRELSNMLAIKSGGGMLKDFRRAEARGRTKELADALFKEGLIVPGNTVDDIAAQVKPLKGSVGAQIGNIYKSVGPVVLDKEALRSSLTNAYSKKAPKLGAKNYQNYMDEVVSEIVDSPNNLSDIRVLNDLIGEIDQRINYQKAIQDLPENQEGLHAIRTALRETVNSVVDDFGRSSGDKNLGKALKDLNKRYANLAEIDSMATDKYLRESANRFYSLGDRVAGSAGAISGAMANAMTGGDEDRISRGLLGAIIGGGLGAAGGRLSRRYGPQTGAYTSKYGSQLLTPITASTGAAANALQSISPSTMGLLGVSAERKPKLERKEK